MLVVSRESPGIIGKATVATAHRGEDYMEHCWGRLESEKQSADLVNLYKEKRVT